MELLELSQTQLDDRVVELQESLMLPHADERRAQLNRELNHAMFEVECRLVESGATVL